MKTCFPSVRPSLVMVTMSVPSFIWILLSAAIWELLTVNCEATQPANILQTWQDKSVNTRNKINVNINYNEILFDICQQVTV